MPSNGLTLLLARRRNMKHFNVKRLATLGGALALVLAGSAANAATIASFTVSISGTTSGGSTGTISGSGTATLDDSGSLTIDSVSTTVTTSRRGTTLISTTTDLADVFIGSFNGIDTLSGNSGTSTVNGCTDNGARFNGCSQLTLGSPTSFRTVSDPIVFNLSPGGSTSINTTIRQGRGRTATNISQVYTLATVPLPAAAFLFGSSLIGLAVVARSRRQA